MLRSVNLQESSEKHQSGTFWVICLLTSDL